MVTLKLQLQGQLPLILCQSVKVWSLSSGSQFAAILLMLKIMGCRYEPHRIRLAVIYRYLYNKRCQKSPIMKMIRILINSFCYSKFIGTPGIRSRIHLEMHREFCRYRFNPGLAMIQRADVPSICRSPCSTYFWTDDGRLILADYAASSTGLLIARIDRDKDSGCFALLGTLNCIRT